MTWLLAFATACSPALNWREMRLGPPGVSALLPCKPSVYARPIVLARANVELTLHACSADGVTWGISHALLGDPALVTPALRALMSSALANIRAAPSRAIAWSPQGATPNTASMRWHVSGRLPDGASIESHAVVFAHGLWVFQATAVGAHVTDEAAETFFAGLQVRP